MRTQVYLMRHGHSLANAADLIVSDPEQGCRSYGLSSLGQQQVDRAVRSAGFPGNLRIYASDFLRTRETAERVRESLGCPPVTLDERLRERFFGQLEGGAGQDYARVWEHDDLHAEQTPWGVESPSHLVERLSRFVLEKLQQHPQETLLLVSHGDPLRFLQLWAEGMDLRRHRQISHFEPAEIRRVAAAVAGHAPPGEHQR